MVCYRDSELFIIGETASPAEALPKEGVAKAAAPASLPGVKMIDGYAVAPGPRPDVYPFARATTLRNLYRIPIP